MENNKQTLTGAHIPFYHELSSNGIQFFMAKTWETVVVRKPHEIVSHDIIFDYGKKEKGKRRK